MSRSTIAVPNAGASSPEVSRSQNAWATFEGVASRIGSMLAPMTCQINRKTTTEMTGSRRPRVPCMSDQPRRRSCDSALPGGLAAMIPSGTSAAMCPPLRGTAGECVASWSWSCRHPRAGRPQPREHLVAEQLDLLEEPVELEPEVEDQVVAAGLLELQALRDHVVGVAGDERALEVLPGL